MEAAAELKQLRVLIDSRIGSATSWPSSSASLEGITFSITVFDEYASAPDILELIASLSPHVIVVDRVWLSISSLLMTLVGLSPDASPRPILGVHTLEDVHKVEAAYHGFDDVIDLARPIDEILRSLRHAASGRSALDGDILWTRISRPVTPTMVLASPQDELDRRNIDLICIGLPDKEIAEVTLHSHQTIRNRISGLLQRSGLSNRTQMAWLHNSQALAALLLGKLHREQSTNLPS